MYVVDQQGRALARLNGEPQPFTDAARGQPALTAAIGGLSYLGDGRDPSSNEIALVAAAPIPELGWSVVAVAKDDALRSEVDAALAQQRALRLGLSAILILGAVLVGTASSTAIRRRREVAEALERQTAVSEVLKIIGRSPVQLGAIFESVITSAVRLCGADNGSIVRIEGGRTYVVAHAGTLHDTAAIDEYWSTHTIAADRSSLTGRVMLERRSVTIADIHTEPEFVVRDLPGQDARQNHSMLGVPLLREGDVVGVIVLRRREIKPFAAADVALAETFADQAVIAIENVRLFNETKDALAQQTAVAQVLETISISAFDLTPIFDVILGQSIRLCVADAGWVALLVDDEHVKMVAALGRIDDRYKTGDVFPPSQMAKRVLAARATVHDPTFSSTDYWGRTRLGVPLLLEDRVVGVIVLGRDDYAKPFTDRQIQLVETFAKQAVIAIENVRLFNQTKEALERQTAVAEVLKTISRSAFDLQPVLDIVLNNAVRLAGADIGWMSRVEDKQFMTVAFSTGFPQSVRDELDHQRAQGQLEGPWVPLGTGGGLMGFTLAEARTVHLPDVKEDPELKGSIVARMTQSRTVVGVPMLREGRSIGGMVLARYEVRPFGEREIELVQTFADQAAIAIENVRLFNETKEALEQQTAVGEVLKTISRSAFDLDLVLATVVETAARLSDADLAWMGRFVQTGIQGSGGPVRWARDGDMSAFRRVDEVLRDPTESAVAGAPGTGGPGSIMARAFRERSTIQIEDITADDELLKESLIARMTGSRTVLAVPLLVEHAAIGTMLVARRTVRRFSEREVQVVETFADQAAIAIHNVRLFNEIQDKSRQLEIASRHKSEFLANMSHELRTPLNAIIGFSEVLAQGLFGDVNEKQREYLQDVIGSGQHLLSLINDILDLSKIEAGRMELELSTFNFRDALQSGVAIVRERASRHDITLSVTVADELGQVEADERKVKQVFYNLLSNAVKFTADGGQVDVTVRRDNGDVRVEVRDNGIGIAEADQARIFEEFQQVGRERSREGTGLGLTLTKRFVELHRGRIWVESAPGQGSTFAFTLPLRQTAAVRA